MRTKISIVTSGTLSLLCLLAASSLAQQGQPSESATKYAPTETSASNLTLSRTNLKTENDDLSLSSTALAAYTATRVLCPAAHTAGCTIKVDASSQVWNLPSSAVIQFGVSITSGLTVELSGLVHVGLPRKVPTCHIPRVFNCPGIKRFA